MGLRSRGYMADIDAALGTRAEWAAAQRAREAARAERREKYKAARVGLKNYDALFRAAKKREVRDAENALSGGWANPKQRRAREGRRTAYLVGRELGA